MGSPRAKPGNPHVHAGQQLLNVGGGDLALHRRIGRQNHLAHPALPHPLHQAVQPQCLRADAVQRRQLAAEHVVTAPEVGRAIDHAHRRGLLHHADHSGISPGIAADGAGLVLSEVAALLAGPHPLGHRGEGRGEALSLFRGLLKQMKSEPLSRLPADSGKPGKFGDQLLDRAHRSERRA